MENIEKIAYHSMGDERGLQLDGAPFIFDDAQPPPSPALMPLIMSRICGLLFFLNSHFTYKKT
jgi:hypothetical protein